MSFKLKNLSTADPRRIVLSPIGDATIAPLEAYADKIVMEDGEAKFCLTPKIVINCAGAENETSIFTIDGDWGVEVDGVEAPNNLTTLEMIDFLRAQGLEVVIYEEINCDGATSATTLELEGDWELTVDGEVVGTYNADDLGAALIAEGFDVIDITPIENLADDAFFMAFSDASAWEVTLDGTAYQVDGTTATLQSGLLPTAISDVLQFEYDYAGLYVRNLTDSPHTVSIRAVTYTEPRNYIGDTTLNNSIVINGDTVSFNVGPMLAETAEDPMIMTIVAGAGNEGLVYFEIIPTENHDAPPPGSTTVVDWGDGNVETLDWDTVGNYYYLNRQYAPGEYTMTIRSSTKLDYLFVGNVKEIVQWGNKVSSTVTPNTYSTTVQTLTKVPNYLPNWYTNLTNFFKGITDTAVLQDIVNWDVQYITNFKGLFYGIPTLDVDLSGWNTSRVYSLNSTFSYVGTVNAGIANWDVSGVAQFQSCFSRAGTIVDDITGWDVSKGTTFTSMFSYCATFNQDISGWVPKMGGSFATMFYNATAFNQDLSQWCVPAYSSTTNFATGSGIAGVTAKLPVWGTCPRGENTV